MPNEADANEARRWLVTDFDRINAGMFADRGKALDAARRLAERLPGNEIHVLETIRITQGVNGGVLSSSPPAIRAIDLTKPVEG